MKHLLVVCALLLSTLDLRAADGLKPGKVELYPTWSAVSIEAAYDGDDNGNGTASFVWRKEGDKDWQNGVDMTFDRKRRLAWASIWPLEPGTKVQVKISYSDADAKGLPDFEGAVTLKTFNLDPKGGTTYFVAPSGADDAAGTKEKPFKTLAHAAKIAKPGDVVQALTGVYAEHDLFAGLKGTAAKPIVFSAAPGATPVIDTSLVLDKKAPWKTLGGGLFVITAEINMSAGGYVAQDGLRMFFYPTLADLKTDKVKVKRAWHYDAKSKQLYVRTGDDAPAAEHVYNLSQHVYGIHLSKSFHVVIRGFTVRYFGGSLVRISEGATGCVLWQNHLHNGPGGIFMKGETTAENAIWHNDIHEPGMNDISWTANYTYEYANQAIYCTKAGRGNSFCHNRIHDHFDLCSVESWKNPDKLQYNRDCDIMFNELYNAGDDAIEVDGGGINMRIHGNAIRNCHTAISLAPIERGPTYVTRNHATFKALFFKFNVGGCTSHGWTYIYHNSGYCVITGPDGGTGISFPPGIPCSNKVMKNNVVVVNEWAVRAGKPNYELDYNCYYNVPGRPPRRFQWEKKAFGTIEEFAAGTKQEVHGQYADPLFVSAPDAGKIEAPSNFADLAPSRFPLVKGVDAGDLRLQATSPCIDRAVVIRGINDNFQGKGPDVGAWEFSK